MLDKKIRIAFVTPGCTHYRLKLFEKLSEHYIVDFFFQKKNREYLLAETKKIKYKILPVFPISKRFHILPTLIAHLLKGNYDIIICDNSRISFTLSVCFYIAKYLGIPFILYSGIWESRKSYFNRIVFPLRKYIYQNSDAIVVYGEHVRKYLIDLGVNPEKFFIAWNTVDNDLFNKKNSDESRLKLRSELGLSKENIILYVGRLSNEKGLKYLLEAYKYIQAKYNVSLLLIGNGPDENLLKRMAIEFKLDKIKFLGLIHYEKLYHYYSIADIFILPSITTKMFKEPWGLVINEAMNQGCPVITTNAVGAAMGGLVEENKTGFIIPEKNSKALIEAIDKILGNPDLKKVFKAAALKKIENWDHELQIEGFLQAISYVQSI